MRFTEVDWPRLPEEFELDEVVGIAIDPDDHVYVLNRGLVPVLIFDTAGTMLDSWGTGVFREPHGIEVHDGLVYCVDYGDHTVRVFTPSGTLLRTIGTAGQASDTGTVERDWYTTTHAGPPFHAPTDLTVIPGGDLVVSDGYGNARLHRFTPDGVLRESWGDLGDGPEQFWVPHSVSLAPDGRLYVSDRENRRVRILSTDGAPLDVIDGVHRPNDAFPGIDGLLYVAELGYRSAVAMTREAPPGRPYSRITVYDAESRPIARIGTDDPAQPMSFVAAHTVCMDSRGDLYVGDAGRSANRGVPPAGFKPVRKLARADR